MNLNGIDSMLLVPPVKVNENVESHPIFLHAKLNSLDELKVFMEHHVFAVWDFMSLLKKLQQMYVPHGSPWIPNSNGNIVRFINEIVMEEESDQSFSSNVQKYSSHFEIYLEAMKEVGASTLLIEKFIEVVRQHGIKKALSLDGLPIPSVDFFELHF